MIIINNQINYQPEETIEKEWILYICLYIWNKRNKRYNRSKSLTKYKNNKKRENIQCIKKEKKRWFIWSKRNKMVPPWNILLCINYESNSLDKSVSHRLSNRSVLWSEPFCHKHFANDISNCILSIHHAE